MANVNKVIFIGRPTNSPEVKTFAGGGKVASFSFAVNGRKKDASGEWVDDPMFIDVSAFNSGNYKLADTVEKFVDKGTDIYVEGRLVLEKWDDKSSGQKRSKHKVVIDKLELLGKRKEAESKPQNNLDHYAAPLGGNPVGDDDVPF